jgi:hypothetical protein
MQYVAHKAHLRRGVGGMQVRALACVCLPSFNVCMCACVLSWSNTDARCDSVWRRSRSRSAYQPSMCVVGSCDRVHYDMTARAI